MKKRNGTQNVMVAALGLVIQNRRKELGLSQEELATRAGLHRTYISEIERRSRNLSVKALIRIAWALNTQTSRLMHDSEEMTKSRDSDEGSSIHRNSPMHAARCNTISSTAIPV
jgi:transcriptional regulator with XRE-family HTH domain